jgi:IS30 family transposase
MGSQFKHLSLSDRNVIHNMLDNGNFQKDIAIALGVNPGTISREIKRNADKGKYNPKHANELAQFRSLKKVYHKEFKGRIYKYIKKCLKNGLSPDIIAGRIKLITRQRVTIAGQTIYNWIDRDIFGVGLRKYLLYGKKGYKKASSDPQKIHKNKKRIDDMPLTARDRSRIGDYEGDSIIGARQQGAIISLAERTSRFIIAGKLKDRTKDSFSQSLRDLFSEIDNDKLKTIVFDNGSEMNNYASDAEMLGCLIYFTYPGRPWEKALVENSNRILRRYFPKKTNLNTVSHEQVLQATNEINHRPRKSLGYRTPFEVFFNLPPIAFAF